MARIVDREAKRAAIVEAAALRFAKSGYEATSMEDLAAAAGVAKGSLYDYFQNKEDLFYAVFEWCNQRVMSAGQEGMQAEESVRARLLAFADASIVAFIDEVDLFPLTLEVWAAAAKSGTRARFSAAMQGLYAAYRGATAAMIQLGQETGEFRKDADAEAISALVVGAIDGLFLQYWLDPSFDLRAWARNFLNVLLDGLESPKG